MMSSSFSLSWPSESYGRQICRPRHSAELYQRLRRLLCLWWNDHFHIERNVHIIAYHHAAAVELLVPGHAEVLPVDLRGSGYGGALQTPGILDGRFGNSCARPWWIEK